MIKRYKDMPWGFDPDDDGKYVVYEDYVALEIKYQGLLRVNKIQADEINRLRDELGWCE